MAPRTILYTGKGGVGKTSVAAATARRCAESGRRTLIISTDPAHSLADSLETATGGGDPVPVDAKDRLWALEIDSQVEMTRHWTGVQTWLGEVLVDRGLDRISAQELTVPPGMDELFSLLRLQEQFDGGQWDVIVVDCAPTGETLRLMSFPDAARWWIEKVFPFERAILAAAAPLARGILDMPLPGGEVFADVERLSRNLISMHEILRDTANTTIRLVMNPDRMVIGEAMRTFTYLNLYGYLTDAVIVNRVFPADVGDYFSRWRTRQEEHLELVRSAFSPVPVLVAPYFDEEVSGATMLDRLADSLFTDQPASGAIAFHPAPDPAAILHDTITQRLISDEHGATLRLSIPFVRKEDISLKQVGLELVVSTPGQRRTIMLPPTLASLSATSARYEDGALEISFTRG